MCYSLAAGVLLNGLCFTADSDFTGTWSSLLLLPTDSGLMMWPVDDYSGG